MKRYVGVAHDSYWAALHGKEEREQFDELAPAVEWAKERAKKYNHAHVWDNRIYGTVWNESLPPNTAVSHAGRTGPESPCGPSPGVAL